MLDFDKKWSDESTREGRVGNWREFQKGPGAKRARVQVGRCCGCVCVRGFGRLGCLFEAKGIVFCV